MLGSLFPFAALNNENNLFIPTNIGYFTRCSCQPDIPLSNYDEKLTNSRVTNQEFAEIVGKVKKECGNFRILFFLWIIRWLTRAVMIFTLADFLANNSLTSEDFSSIFPIVISGSISLYIIVWFICRKLVNIYRRKIEVVLNIENESKYTERNLFWKVMPGCRYLHLILNYSNYINPQVVVVTDPSQIMYVNNRSVIQMTTQLLDS